MKVEDLASESNSQGNQLAKVEKRLQDEGAEAGTGRSSTKSQIQPEHILQQMNEKYIDLAAKVDLLANELLASGERDKVKDKKTKDREALYLSQMEAVRRDLEIQQARYQDEMQVKVYQTMLNVFNMLNKKQGLPPAFANGAALLPSSNGSEEKCSEDADDQEASQVMVPSKGRQKQGYWPRSRGGMGYSMASGIITQNLFVPTMMSVSQGGGQNAKDDGHHANDS